MRARPRLIDVLQKTDQWDDSGLQRHEARGGSSRGRILPVSLMYVRFLAIFPCVSSPVPLAQWLSAVCASCVLAGFHSSAGTETARSLS